MMDAERFQILAGAYGGDLSRWPLADQAQARAFMADDRRTSAWLADEAALDALLTAAAERPHNELLRERIIRSAPKPEPVTVRRAAWASWAGLAAACAAGIIAGAQLTSSSDLVNDPVAEATAQASTAFADSPLSEPLGDEG